MREIFALDVGGVLASRQHDGEPMPGCYHAVIELNDKYELWVVSQCGRNRALKTREWLTEHHFPIPQSRQIYIPFSESKVDPLKRIGASYFVDDRLKHVIPALREVRSLRRVYHLADIPSEGSYRVTDERYKWVPTWDDLLRDVEWPIVN